VTAHPPKIAALIAHREGALSDAGRARIERHLASCPECRRARATIALYDDTASAIRATAAPALDWEKMERALAREIASSGPAGPDASAPATGTAEPRRASTDTEAGAPATARTISTVDRRARGATRTRWAALAIAAVVLLGVWAWPRRVPEELAHDAPIPAAVPELEPSAAPAPLTASVTLIAGRSTARIAGEELPLSVGDALVEGASIATAARSELHLSIDRSTASERGLALGPSSAATLSRMREDAIEIALEGGTIASVTPPTGERSARYAVLAAAHRFEAHGTRFEVELEAPTEGAPIGVGSEAIPGALFLAVTEGSVAVHRPDGTVVIVTAPGTWSSRGAGRATPEVREVRGLGEPEGGARLALSHPDVVRWEIDGQSFDGAGAVELRVRQGEHAIVALDASGRAFRTVATVGGNGLTLGTRDIAIEPMRHQRAGYLPPADIEGVVRRGMLRMRACYEHAMRDAPDLGGSLMMRITIGLEGEVTRAQVVGGDVPEGLQTCVRGQAERWMFPPPEGGPLTFEVPLSFAARSTQ
jgi:hypothetical protein